MMKIARRKNLPSPFLACFYPDLYIGQLNGFVDTFEYPDSIATLSSDFFKPLSNKLIMYNWYKVKQDLGVDMAMLYTRLYDLVDILNNNTSDYEIKIFYKKKSELETK